MLKGEKRREQILAAAEEMFYQNGYERTTVSDIITALGLSKGGFYHHFESKEALLQAICDRKAEDSYAAARRAVDDCPGSWADKFNAMFDQYGMWQSGNADFMGLLIRVAYREDNLIMRDKLKRKSIGLMLPLVEEIVKGGVAAQEFITPYPEGTGMLVLQLGIQLFRFHCGAFTARRCAAGHGRDPELFGTLSICGRAGIGCALRQHRAVPDAADGGCLQPDL